MSNGRRGFLSLSVTREQLDPETRRTVPVDPPRVELRLTTPAGSVQTVELLPDEFAKLIQQTGAAAAFMLREL